MRTLLLMRHAKSDWKAPYAGDHERPLNRRGERASDRMGAWLAGDHALPTLVMSSSAVRARDTAARAAAAGSWDCEIEIEPALYGASDAELVEVVRQLPDAIERPMLVGHEPTMSSAVSLLTGATVRFPTAAAARIDLPVGHWSQLRPGIGTLIWLVPPRSLDEIDELR